MRVVSFGLNGRTRSIYGIFSEETCKKANISKKMEERNGIILKWTLVEYVSGRELDSCGSTLCLLADC
jgi:hypothetical protein